MLLFYLLNWNLLISLQQFGEELNGDNNYSENKRPETNNKDNHYCRLKWLKRYTGHPSLGRTGFVFELCCNIPHLNGEGLLKRKEEILEIFESYFVV